MSINIPEYPSKRPINLSDKEVLAPFLFALQPVISELTFANLYLFRHVHRYSLSIIDDSVVVFGTGYDDKDYFLPPLSGGRGAAARKLIELGNTLYGADENFITTELEGSRFSIADDRDNDDYLYLQSDLATLAGRKYHKKNNRINYFRSRHEYEVEPFSAIHYKGALTLIERWEQAKDMDKKKSVLAETAATIEAVTLIQELNLSGMALLVDGEVAAFALGERLNSDTVVCHFEKADPFMEGAAQLINREFSRNQTSGCIYINREQDLGDSGLRTAKISYHPVRMVRKLRVMSIT